MPDIDDLKPSKAGIVIGKRGIVPFTQRLLGRTVAVHRPRKKLLLHGNGQRGFHRVYGPEKYSVLVKYLDEGHGGIILQGDTRIGIDFCVQVFDPAFIGIPEALVKI